ncbi:non-heme iron oxygenase ferredoxin subunit [Actinosynnema sp. CS-041913]|uniref:non-heme iron oxygenase ferredoxin subunit n=1 Tax=Actinosynnema sp. CS-041913 TaxID=3239917 RepID=UPI003D942B6A
MEEGFVRVCALGDMPEEGLLAVEVDDTPLAIVRSGGEVHAVLDRCSHADVPLTEGEVYGGVVECWLHGSCFELRTGKPTSPPATEPITVFRAAVENGDVYVRVPPEA